jgi:GTP-binding protein YchF
MKLGIIGKPQSGKTTVFNAASGKLEAVGDFSKTAHRSIIKVPDERVNILAKMINPKKITFAEIEFLDAPGFSGKGKEATEVDINPELRLMDALIVVLDAFTPDSNPKTELNDLMDEMILADQVMIENNIEKRDRKIKLTGDKVGKMEVDFLRKCQSHLEEEKLLIDLEMSDQEEKSVRGYMFLTQKPLLVVLNIAEDNIKNSAELLKQFDDFISPGKREVTSLCGNIEMELISLDESDRKMFMTELGIEKPAVDEVIQKSYSLIGLISYLTAAEPEVRAWTIRKGMTAQKAAGVIHTDIERGFIRAEVISYDDYLEYKTPSAIKAAGKMRLEGKEYIVKDGDVILFRFNV